jgi:hypothetical protein
MAVMRAGGIRSGAQPDTNGTHMTRPNSGKRSRRVLFVLGSGVSLKPCPSVAEITDKILTSDLVLDDWNSSNLEAADERSAVQGFLRVLRDDALRTVSHPNYEDLYSLCLRLQSYELSLRPDPGLTRFRDAVYRGTAHLHRRYLGGIVYGREPLAAICTRSRGFINEAVRQLLRPHTDAKGKLDLIVKSIKKYGEKHVDVLTLNHDLLLENALTEAGIGWTDGFDKAFSRERIDGFDTALPDNEHAFEFDCGAFLKRSLVRILKIHGGCDWYLCLSASGKWRPVKLGKDAQRSLYTTDYDQCLTLTGSTTKGDAYTRGVLGDINWESRRLLREHNRIVCSGYGWKDEAFNAMLKDWSDSREDARMLLLHGEGSIQEFEGLRKPWPWPNGWKTRSGWLKWHPKWLSDTTLCDLDEFCLMGRHSRAAQKRSKSK